MCLLDFVTKFVLFCFLFSLPEMLTSNTNLKVLEPNSAFCPFLEL